MQSTFMLEQLTKVINHTIALDPESHKHLQPLINHTLALTITEFHYTFHIEFHEEGLRLTLPNSNEVHARIKGSSSTFLHIVKDPKRLPLHNKLEISGDMALIQEIRHFFKNLQIDWEEILSHYTGDHLSHGFFSTLKKFKNWLHEGKHSLLKNTEAYIHHEIQLTPTLIEVENFHKAIAKLRNDVECLEKRLENYSKRNSLA